MRRIVQTLSLLLSVASLWGCSSAEEDAAPGAVCRLDKTIEDPSFREHILPIFQGSCTFSNSCHGDNRPKGLNHINSQADRYLGKKQPNPAKNVLPMTDEEVSEMLAGIVNVPSTTAPAVNVITAGDANASFLMHKLDNTQGDQGYACEAQTSTVEDPCGDPMPQTSEEILCINDRDTIRNWINAGAKDN